MDTLQQHLEMFRRRQESLKRMEGMAYKQVIYRVNDPASWWYEKIRIAKEARKLGQELRKGKSAVFTTGGRPRPS